MKKILVLLVAGATMLTALVFASPSLYATACTYEVVATPSAIDFPYTAAGNKSATQTITL